MKSILTIGSFAIVLALPLTALAGSDVKDTELTFYSGTFETNAVLLAKCEASDKECQADLLACNETLSVIQSIPGCVPGGSGPAVKSSKPKPKKKHKKPKGDKQICKSSKYNGMWSHYGWDLSFCDVEASLDGYCLTVKDLHKVDKCLNKRLEKIEELDLADLIERVEELEKMEKIGVVDGNYVTPEQLQAVVDMIMAHIKALRVVVDELAPEVSKLREDVDALTKRVDAIEDELAKLKELVLKHEACLFPEEHPDMFDTDVYGKILSESYREVCGVLADIPEMDERLDAIEECLGFSDAFHNKDAFVKACEPFNWVLEVQAALDTIYLCKDPLHPYWNGNLDEYAFACHFEVDAMCSKMEHDDALLRVDGDEEKLKKICKANKKVKAALGKEPGLAAMCFGTFRGDVWCGGVMNWTALLIKKENKTVVEFSVFAGAMAGVTSEADGGITYGGNITIYPGPQEVFGIFIGYQGLSSGVFEAEYAGQPDPDTQHHAAMAGIKLKKMWTVKEVDGKIFKVGIYGSAGAGPCWQDDSSGSGVTGCWKGDVGFSFSAEW